MDYCFPSLNEEFLYIDVPQELLSTVFRLNCLIMSAKLKILHTFPINEMISIFLNKAIVEIIDQRNLGS